MNKIPSTKNVVDKPKKNGQCGPRVILGYLSALYQYPVKFPNRTTVDATWYLDRSPEADVPIAELFNSLIDLGILILFSPF